jgi:DNA-binding response OmpR family regulator
MQNVRVLLVEPEKTCREKLIGELARRGIAVRCVDGAAPLLAMPKDAVDGDVIVAGWGMPKMSALEMWGRLRRNGVDIPFVLVAGPTLSADDCLAFEPDAGRFVGKARGVDALVRRLKVLARGFGAEARPTLGSRSR